MVGGNDNTDNTTTHSRIRGRKSAANLSVASLNSAQLEESRVSSSPPDGADGGAKTTEDPYVQAALKRSLVELYNTCHRLLSFKVKC